MTTTAACLGAAAIEALRAATLAAHHAAGLCRSAHLFNAARTARTGEALLRSATVLAGVQAPAGAPKAQRPSPQAPRQPRAGDATGAEGGATEPRTASSAKKTKRGKKKKKDMDMDAPLGLALTAAPIADPVYASGLLDDSWADHVALEFRPLCLQTLRRTQLPRHPPQAGLGVCWHSACLASALRRLEVAGISLSVIS